MSSKLAPRRTGKMRKQIVHLPFTRKLAQPAMKRRRGKGTKVGKIEMIMHYRPKDF